VTWIVVLAIGLVLGFAMGRWLTLVLAVAFGAWIWSTTGIEIPHWLLGLLYGSAGAIGIATGVAARAMFRKQAQR
jgi:hypothetical protein